MARKVISTPETCSGSPRIEGTRLTCANVVLTLASGEISVDEYLEGYPYLDRQDLVACAAYCAAQRCIDDKVPSFCQGCSLDRRTAEPCENSDVAKGPIEVGFDELYEDDAVDVWEYAAELVPALDQ